MAAQTPRIPKQSKKETSGAPLVEKPTLTRAERRAQQEKEREAKAAAKASAASNKVNGVKATPSKASSSAGPAAHQQQHKVTKAVEGGKSSPASKDMPPAAIIAVEALEHETRGLRIFSHFGLPKHTGSSNLRGPLHPAIFRLGLQFSEFRIVGANARCIATLDAFKTVCLFSGPYSNRLMNLRADHTRLRHPRPHNNFPTPHDLSKSTNRSPGGRSAAGRQYGKCYPAFESRN
jgi:translation initiation factor eIF-2B subunit delta